MTPALISAKSLKTTYDCHLAKGQNTVGFF